eukprot:TRINITY_DN5320_c0_g1_i1.p2 TRINITY_DN5320_c0_g1~~TRINITY_DN5320_c0_g1_i1.p2  ORF type:complete len:230 (-),score=37.04 TRINITY_DN5320_c0_g1_i1:386-1075(-)
MVRTVLCYGDSNTWGFDPVAFVQNRGEVKRLPDRWPLRLGRLCGEQFQVVEEGLNARTTVWDDPTGPAFGQYSCNGREYLMPCLHSHNPIDVVVLALGTNDMKSYFAAGAERISAGVAVLVNDIMGSGCGPHGKPPKVLLLVPPRIIETRVANGWSFEGTGHKAESFGRLWAGVSREPWPEAVECLELDSVAKVSELDGIHFEGGETQSQISAAVHQKLMQMLAAPARL